MTSPSLDDFSAPGLSASTPKGWESGANIGPDGGEVCSGPVAEPISDWAGILKVWNLDPAAWLVVGEATFKAWDGYCKDADGRLASKRMYSYKIRVRRASSTAVSEDLVSQWHDRLLSARPIDPAKRTKKRAATRGATYAMYVADPQIGKKGTREALDNWEQGVAGHVKRIRVLQSMGYPITDVLVAFMGDEHEQVANNYVNQPYTVEMNFSQQIETDFSMRVWTLDRVADLGLPILATSVISNHGEWTRNGSKDPVTSKADNSSTSVMRLVEKLVRRVPALGGVSFAISESKPDLVMNVSGVGVRLSHGHIEKGRGGSVEQRMKNAVERQILGRTKELSDVKIYVQAHYHHFYMQEFEGRTLFGCPALEAEQSSEYMLDQYGVWSKPGMLGFLISDQWERGWAEVSIL